MSNRSIFILGAGASFPYSFPLGSELTIRIRQLSKNLHNPGTEHLMILFNALNNKSLHPELVKNFHNDFVKSGAYSIDFFLENRQEYMQLGKYLIAFAFIDYEMQSLNTFFNYDSGQDDWYRYLWNSISTDRNKIDCESYSFITFNYDRSLEYYLYNAILHLYNLSPEESLNILSKLNIIHVYGSLGSIVPEQPDFLPYGIRTFNENTLDNIVKSIKIISEGDNSNLLTSAKSLLHDCHRILITGFGYHKTNFDRLDLWKFINSSKHIVHLNRKGKTDQELSSCVGEIFSARQHNSTNTEFLRNIDLNETLPVNDVPSVLFT